MSHHHFSLDVLVCHTLDQLESFRSLLLFQGSMQLGELTVCFSRATDLHCSKLKTSWQCGPFLNSELDDWMDRPQGRRMISKGYDVGLVLVGRVSIVVLESVMYRLASESQS